MELNPGIRKTVAWLQSLGYATCDSGDGKTHDYECDQPFAYVSMQVPAATLVGAADDLANHLRVRGLTVVSQTEAFMAEDGSVLASPKAPNIQATYDPGDGIGILMLVGVDDELLFHRLDG